LNGSAWATDLINSLTPERAALVATRSTHMPPLSLNEHFLDIIKLILNELTSVQSGRLTGVED
jgi:hypothetical protein